jgi:hypothetical protein
MNRQVIFTQKYRKERIMGEQYKEGLRQRIDELGAENLRVYINQEGVHPRYYEHLEATFTDAGVKFVASRREANFVFEGHCEPVNVPGQVVAYFRNDALQFAGML